ncbi:MAG: YdcF family protein [Pseudomonadota bacterium]
MNEQILRHAQILWNYNRLNHNIKSADFIFLPCSYNLSVADYTADLFKKNYGAYIAVSGGIAHQDDLLNTNWNAPEADIFANRLKEKGVPKEKIFIETKATNSGENAQFTKALLAESNLFPKMGLIVQKPYMERRAYATACKQWLEVEWQVTSPAISMQDYMNTNGFEKTINIIVGDTVRIKPYAEKGFQTEQEMPEKVEESLQKLIEHGYNKHL